MRRVYGSVPPTSATRRVSGRSASAVRTDPTVSKSKVTPVAPAGRPTRATVRTSATNTNGTSDQNSWCHVWTSAKHLGARGHDGIEPTVSVFRRVPRSQRGPIGRALEADEVEILGVDRHRCRGGALERGPERGHERDVARPRGILGFDNEDRVPTRCGGGRDREQGQEHHRQKKPHHPATYRLPLLVFVRHTSPQRRGNLRPPASRWPGRHDVGTAALLLPADTLSYLKHPEPKLDGPPRLPNVGNSRDQACQVRASGAPYRRPRAPEEVLGPKRHEDNR